MTEKTFTKEELAAYDGVDGNKAYVAVDGVVYDVSNVAPWKGGSHHGNKAGTDATEGIGHSPHGKKVLNKLNVVGKLVD
ncbi:cytochrome B5 [Ligilactobacillus sp. WILCCON 0076]|uniref:Cytochrome B5 n=1 Tax=Ligilactobacillus ubinensis TaxID=2876789 RepID=A0A9X2JLA5_9LACO|nr:cytochrome b5 domain-containing protein [Ligilactobacillus ubinensis]MCP0886709.1 cytochrome B5 [Ligilactobacillus ubinensis]